MKRALISVYDKSGLLDLAKLLEKNGVGIISTGKTYQHLLDNNIKVQKLSEYTGSPEIFGGRVKTLHPKIHGGILANREIHTEEMLSHNIPAIDIVITNLYPFFEYVKNNASEEDIIENIDIGGITLLRAAAKNFKYITVLSDIEDYKTFHVDNSLEYRENLAKKAFQITAKYDAEISTWFDRDEILPKNLSISVEKEFKFRYGENPHQQGGFYGNEKFPFSQLQGKELSYNNILDSDAAFKLCQEFETPAAVIVKHNNPCGVAMDDNILVAYQKALKADELSAFGGIVALNRPITEELAKKLSEIFFEVIIAPNVEDKAKAILQNKKNLRVLTHNSENEFFQKLKIRSAFNGLLVQEEDSRLFKDLEVVTKRQPTKDELEQLKFAWKICKYVKSNAIVVAKDFQTVGIGAGQMNRIGSANIALKNSSDNLALASDAFFPFSDSIEFAAKNGVTAIIQPGGSIKDKLVIQAADDYNISMIFTKMRHFLH